MEMSAPAAGRTLRQPPFQRGQPELELVYPMPEDLQLGLVGQPPFRSAAQPGRGLGAGGDHRERHQSLRPVRPVDQPGRDLPGPVPAAQGGPGRAGVRHGPVKRHPVGAFEPGAQLEFEFPVVEAVFPLHITINSMVLTG